MWQEASLGANGRAKGGIGLGGDPALSRLLLSPAHDVGIQDLNPFLVIAGISVTRRILTIGASLSVTETEGQTLDPVKFQHYMIELVISGMLILLVAVSLWLINRRMPGRAAR